MNLKEAKRWLDYAESDLKACKTLLRHSEHYPRQVCFLAQQAAEKALKAVLVLLEIDFPFTHDLDRLREMIPSGWRVKEAFPKLYSVSIWAVESRYPGDTPDADESEVQDAVSTAEAIYQIITQDMEIHFGNPMNLNSSNILSVKESFLRYPLPPDLYAIIRMQHRKTLWMEMTQGQCRKISQHIMEGMGCQIFRRNGDTALVSAEEISPSSLQNCLNKAAALCPESLFQRKITAERLFSAPALTDRKIIPVSHGFDTVSPAQAKEALLAFHRELMQLDTGISCSTSFTVIHEEWRILRSDGSDVHFTMPRSLFRHEMSLWADGKNYTLHTGFVGSDFSILREKELQEMIRRRVKDRLLRLRELVHAPQVPHGSHPILLDAHLTGGLVHEAFGHATESDSVFRGSILSEKGKFRTGFRLGGENLSITEGPVEYDWGFQPFSANAFPRENVTLVKNGILHQALADHFTADPIGVIPTGAERAESFSHAPIPRMSSIRLEIADSVPWDCDFEDVSAQELYDFLLKNRIAEPNREYLFLSGYKGGQVNSTSGDFVFNSSLIYRFAHGKAVLHKPAIFSGNIFAVLNSVRRGIGRLHVRRSGMCGKSGQKVPTSGGGPLFTLIDAHSDIRIGGK